ncbi:unnamed protein product [Arctia plantaginis]|uniref:Endonuclease/exonuclease/phosphatase domain-containing protein n=1 Tax=Arctia plantaginis TaxID=874455 RepID=A0A8S0ZNK3_ARCPL|nr:unnamed protein product [Arctia plantaginis]
MQGIRKCVLSDDPANARRCPVPGPDGVKSATEVIEEIGNQVSEGRNVTGGTKDIRNKISIRAHHRIGTWNTNGILHSGKLSIVDKERENHRISILGISETHLRGQGHFNTTTGSTLYFSGREDSSRNGVAIFLSSNMNKFVLGYNPVSDRIISLKLNTKPYLWNIVQIYAPTAQASDEDINEFYGSLEKTLDAIPSRQITIILGDWNAKVGNVIPDYTIKDTIGKYGLGTKNKRGQ